MKLKNKKGFTLIELLAVIVVLAIIALIATPIVMNTIKNAKKGAAERTADNYIKQVETAVAEAKLENKSVPNGTYDIDKDGNLTGEALPDGKLEIDMSGNKPTSGKITIKNNGVGKDKSNVKIGDYIVSYDKDNNKQQAQELYKGTLCTKTDGVDLTNLKYGNKFICDVGDGEGKVFYVLEDGDTTTLTEGRLAQSGQVSLIMGSNVTEEGKSAEKGYRRRNSWVSKNDYLASGGTEDNWNKICTNCGNSDLGPITAETTLKKYTATWIKITSPQITLPTAQQIAIAGGETTEVWNTSSGRTYKSLSSWLWENLYNGDGPFQYWTSTILSTYPYYACAVGYAEYLDCINNVVNTVYNGPGVRPVITVSKSNLS